MAIAGIAARQPRWGHDGAIEETNPRPALLIVSFGGPESPEGVMPFLRRVTSGRPVPEERLQVVARNYYARDGVSPLNGLIRQLLPVLRSRVGMPVYWGNRNAPPLLAETVAAMAEDGITSALAFVTSAFASPSGCRQYLDDLESARAQVGSTAPRIEKLRLFHNHPGFLEPFAERTREAWSAMVDSGCARPRLVFTAHSLPVAMADSAPYVDQLTDAAAWVAPEGVAWDLVYQSRSGPPTVPWLEPDIGAHLAALAEEGIDGVVVVPIGFVMDHMEVVHDLDTEAAAVAEGLGMAFARVATPWPDPRFAEMIVELVAERTEGTPPRSVGELAVWPDICPPDCCRPRP